MHEQRKSLSKFLVSGLTAFAVEYGSFYEFYVGLHWHLYLANSLSFILGLLTSFTLNRQWTFGHGIDYKKKTTHQFGYYALLAAINFALTNLIVELLATVTVNPRFGKLIAMVITSLWNYTLFKRVIFTHRSTPATTE